MNSRIAQITRRTQETDIQVELNLDGDGKYEINTPIPFLNHMLEGFAKHGLFDLSLKAEGDVEIDLHHTVEDVGIALGQAFQKGLGNKERVYRYGSCTLPMDEVLTTVSVDFSGRAYFVYQSMSLKPGRIGQFDVELVPEFFRAFAQSALMNLHINLHYGENRHHIVESMFKAFAKACDAATQIDPRQKGVPSTKGIL